MDSTWTPAWLGAAWTLVYAAVLVNHARHVWHLRGTHRWWHLSHVVMALGMIDMFVPTHTMPVGEDAGETVFAVAAVVAAAAAAVQLLRGAGYLLWLITIVDLAAMSYMFAMISDRSAPVTLVLVAWSLIEAALWAGGWGIRLFGARVADQASGMCEDAPSALSLRWSLTLMLLGMAYMFLAMQYGMGSMGGSHLHGPGTNMPGMHM